MSKKNQSDRLEVYLGKSGKVFGPFSREEYDQMFADDQLSKYTWLWDWKLNAWKPLDVPPPPPEGLSLPLNAGANAGAAGGVRSGAEVDWSTIQGILFDRFCIAGGKIQKVTETGCTFVTEDVSEGEACGPRFPLKSRAEVNLFDASLKKCTRTPVTIVSVEHQGQAWVYQVRWDEVPRFK